MPIVSHAFPFLLLLLVPLRSFHKYVIAMCTHCIAYTYRMYIIKCVCVCVPVQRHIPERFGFSVAIFEMWIINMTMAARRKKQLLLRIKTHSIVFARTYLYVRQRRKYYTSYTNLTHLREEKKSPYVYDKCKANMLHSNDNNNNNGTYESFTWAWWDLLKI